MTSTGDFPYGQIGQIGQNQPQPSQPQISKTRKIEEILGEKDEKSKKIKTTLTSTFISEKPSKEERLQPPQLVQAYCCSNPLFGQCTEKQIPYYELNNPNTKCALTKQKCQEEKCHLPKELLTNVVAFLSSSEALQLGKTTEKREQTEIEKIIKRREFDPLKIILNNINNLTIEIFKIPVYEGWTEKAMLHSLSLSEELYTILQIQLLNDYILQKKGQHLSQLLVETLLSAHALILENILVELDRFENKLEYLHLREVALNIFKITRKIINIMQKYQWISFENEKFQSQVWTIFLSKIWTMSNNTMTSDDSVQFTKKDINVVSLYVKSFCELMLRKRWISTSSTTEPSIIIKYDNRYLEFIMFLNYVITQTYNFVIPNDNRVYKNGRSEDAKSIFAHERWCLLIFQIMCESLPFWMCDVFLYQLFIYEDILIYKIYDYLELLSKQIKDRDIRKEFIVKWIDIIVKQLNEFVFTNSEVNDFYHKRFPEESGLEALSMDISNQQEWQTVERNFQILYDEDEYDIQSDFDEEDFHNYFKMIKAINFMYQAIVRLEALVPEFVKPITYGTNPSENPEFPRTIPSTFMPRSQRIPRGPHSLRRIEDVRGLPINARYNLRPTSARLSQFVNFAATTSAAALPPIPLVPVPPLPLAPNEGGNSKKKQHNLCSIM